jgi:hypothetical protein
VYEVLVELLFEMRWKLEHLESHKKKVEAKLIESCFFFYKHEEIIGKCSRMLIDEQKFEHLFQQFNELRDKVHDCIIPANFLIKSFWILSEFAKLGQF